MDTGKREDQLLEKIFDLMNERAVRDLEIESLKEDLMVAVEAALVR